MRCSSPSVNKNVIYSFWEKPITQFYFRSQLISIVIFYFYYHFLVALASIYEVSIESIVESMTKFVEKDKDNKYFTYLNNGNICESFKERNNFIDYLKTSNYLEYDLVGELSAIPGVISNKGINYYILTKQTILIKKALEKEQTKERYY